MSHSQNRTSFEQAAISGIRMWNTMPQSRLAVFVNLIAIIGILGLAFTGRLPGEWAAASITIIQGGISAFLYKLAVIANEADPEENEQIS